MALNTIHRDKNDKVNAFNVTQNFNFKCDILDNVEAEKIQTALGLNLPSVRLTLKVNGHSNCIGGDTIQVLNQKFIIAKIGDKFSMKNQFRKRVDYSYFNGEQYLFLE